MGTKPLWRPEADSIARLTGKASVRAYYWGGRTTRQTVSRPRGEMQAWCSSSQEFPRVTGRGEAWERWGRGVGLHKDTDKCQVLVNSGDGAGTKIDLTEIRLAHHLLKCFLADSGLLGPLWPKTEDPTAGQRNQTQNSKSLSRFHSRIKISSTN